MRWFSCSFVALFAGVLTAQFSPAAAQIRQPTGEALLALNPSEATPSGDAVVYAVGDRIKITFFEQLRSPGRALLSDLVERSELSGEHHVQQDGQVFLPLLGPVRAAGLSPLQVQEALALAFTSRSEGQVRVAVQLIEREPVYVTGPVTRPGTFKHVPGMTVLHALTLAGGLEGANQELWKIVDLGRERERLRKSAERLKVLLAKVAVLKAERDGKGAEAPTQLVQLMGRALALELIATEERLRALQRRRTKEQTASLEQLIAATTNERATLQEKMEQVEKRILEKAERARSVNASRSRGNITDSTFYMAQSELSDARERWHETRASVIQTGRKLAELQQERMRVTVEAEIAREQDLKQAMHSVSEEEVTTAVIGNLLSTMPDTYGRRRLDQQVSFTIIRRTASGPTRISASEDVTLQPGDLLQVVPAGEAVVHGPSGSAIGLPSSM